MLFLETGSPAKSLYENCDFINVFLSSKSQRRLGLSQVNTRYNNRRLFTSESSNPSVPMSFRCVFGFEKTVDVFESIIVWQTHKVVAMHCQSHILIWTVEQCCTVLASSEASKLSTDQIHTTELPDVGSVLGSIHALDQSANFVFAILLTIFGWESDTDYSLGCSLEMCSADVVVSQLQ